MAEVETSEVSTPRDIWTRLAVDPLADPLAVWLARRRGVTPNRLTGCAVALSAAAGVCFATGLLRIGGALFVIRFFFDCLDGNVARAQGTSSVRGASLDVAADVGGIAFAAGCLMWFLVKESLAPTAVALALLGALGFYNWALSHRKDLAHQASSGNGGSGRQWQTQVPILRTWVAFCQRMGMSPLPWSVEVEIAMLGLSPLLLPSRWLIYPVAAGLGFYLLANALNMRRIWALTAILDEG